VPKITVVINKETGELQVMTDGVELTFAEGVELTDQARALVAQKIGGTGLIPKSEVEQHKPEGGVKHAHMVTHHRH